jgi:hypothetical protein
MLASFLLTHKMYEWATISALSEITNLAVRKGKDHECECTCNT